MDATRTGVVMVRLSENFSSGDEQISYAAKPMAGHLCSTRLTVWFADVEKDLQKYAAPLL